MTAEARYGRTVALSMLVLLSVLCVSVSSTITARKDRRDVPRKINVSELKHLLHRQKRAAPNSTSGSHNHEVFLKEVVLNGTEHHSHAIVHWSGKQTSDVMFILTMKYQFSNSGTSGVVDSQLWRSEDYGNSFSEWSFGNNVLISSFFVSPADPTKMVFTDTAHKRLYRTDDELETNHSFPMPVASDDLYMHPYQSDWMLLYDFDKRDLYVSQDFGATWTHLQSQVYYFVWGEKDYDDPHIVHIEIHPWDSKDAYYKRCTIPLCNATGDGVDQSLGPFLTANMLVVNEYIFVQKTLLDGSDSHLMVSYKRGDFSHAYFPGSVKTRDFQVLDATEGQVFVAVNHGSHMGVSLYLSDPTGHYYVLSLTDVHHQAFGQWFEVDMHRVKGLNGVYLANQQSKANANHLKSLVSFNKGGTWQDIPTPQGANCTSDQKGNCSFVLRLDFQRYFSNWILSEERAPGLIMAHGHVGHTYEYDWSNLTVFTSSDGGWIWTNSSLKGVYHFNILDQGSIITAVKTGYHERTAQVFFSYNETGQWHHKVFRDGMLRVDGVLNEPSINTLVVSVYGHVNRYSPWTMVKLNFSEVLPTKCKNHTDYEPWMPSDHDTNLTENCLLGQEVKYNRKKLSVVCFNGENFNQIIQKSACRCAAEDFECNFGFTLHSNGSCVREPWFNDAFIAPECIENQTYNKTLGYRKVGSDHCEGGVAGQPQYQASTPAKCPLITPGPLTLSANVTVVATGQPVLFHLMQKTGSVHTTQYVWNFTDHKGVTTVTELPKTRHQVHEFSFQGRYDVQVTATNRAGTQLSNVVKVKAEYSISRVAVFHPWAVLVGVPLKVSVTTNVWSHRESSLHFLYLFGDEAKNQKELLTYAQNATHTFSSTGKFTLSVTAANSISAVTKQSIVTVVDDGVVVQLNFSSNVDRLFSYSQSSFIMDRFRQELTTVLGVNLDRLATSLNSTRPVRMEVLILRKLPKAPASEMTAEQIAQTFVDMVENQTFSLFQDTTYIRWLGPINVTYVQVMDYTGGGGSGGNKTGNDTGHSGDHTGPDDHDSDTGSGGNKTGNNTGHSGDHTGPDDHHAKKNGINRRAIYIAVPVVVVTGIIAAVIVVCRRRARARRYSLLHQRDGAADPFFDEDDDLPLDMSDARDTGRTNDDPMLDIRSGN
ncbi:hypothetical protein ACOMHN_006115 [Nucella lapillus]